MVAHIPGPCCSRSSLLVCLVLMATGCADGPQPGDTAARFTIDLRDEIVEGRFDPTHHSVEIRGAVVPLRWDAGIALEDTDGDSVYTGRVEFPRPGIVDYKVKLNLGDDAESLGWETGRNRQVSVDAGAEARVQRKFNAPQPELEASRAENVELIPVFESAYGLSDRPIEVFLPPGYAALDTTTYPVLYLHDGQNVFDQRPAGAEWHVDEAANRLIDADVMRPVIVVAVGHSPDRMDEYTFAADAEGRGGDAAAYSELLTGEIMPFIAARYRVRTGPSNTAVGGSSLGGLITLYLMTEHPDVFGSGLVASPSVWWAGQSILDVLPEPAPGRRLWVDVGTAEGANMLQGARLLRDRLVALGWTMPENMRYLEADQAAHNERAWAARVPEMLRFLYASPPD